MVIGETHKVLDHGYVKLVGHMGSDETVIEAARMSTGKGFISWEPYRVCNGCQGVSFAADMPVIHDPACEDRGSAQDAPRGDLGLLEFLYKNQHSTPFEMCELAFEIQAPIMVFRELFRHRVLSINEFSARYSQMPNIHYLPELERFQKQSTFNKQGSAEPLPPDIARAIRGEFEAQQLDVYVDYDENVNEFGLAKEVARLNTPVSRYSKARVKTNLRNWFGILNLRKRPNAQWEIQQFMGPISSIIGQAFPRSYALFLEHDLNGVRLSATEAKALLEMLNPKHPDAEFGVPGRQALLKKLGGA
jgi:thymidylate synthase (FAD)